MNRAESSHSLIGLRIENPRVRGSIPRLVTMNMKASQQCEAFLFLASGRYPVFSDSPSRSITIFQRVI